MFWKIISTLFNINDSWDIVPFINRVEERFGIGLPDFDAYKIKTLGELHEHITKRLKANQIDVNSHEIWYEISTIASEEFAVDINEITPEIRFVEDLDSY